MFGLISPCLRHYRDYSVRSSVGPVLVFLLTINFQCLSNFKQSILLAIWLQKFLTKLSISPSYCKRLLPRVILVRASYFILSFFFLHLSPLRADMIVQSSELHDEIGGDRLWVLLHVVTLIEASSCGLQQIVYSRFNSIRIRGREFNLHQSIVASIQFASEPVGSIRRRKAKKDKSLIALLHWSTVSPNTSIVNLHFFIDPRLHPTPILSS